MDSISRLPAFSIGLDSSAKNSGKSGSKQEFYNIVTVFPQMTGKYQPISFVLVDQSLRGSMKLDMTTNETLVNPWTLSPPQTNTGRPYFSS